MNQINTLTGLRGIAAMMVFFSHCANLSFIPRFMGRGFGRVGVMIFFVLSGFLMSYLYLQRDFDRENVRRYLLSRVGRIFPLYLAVLGVSWVISNHVYPDFYYDYRDVGVWLRAVTFVYTPYVLWTIPVEVQYYAAFVGWWWIYHRYGARWLFGGYIALFIGLLVFTWPCFRPPPNLLITYAPFFFLGGLTAFVYGKIRCSRAVGRFTDVVGAPLFVLLLMNLPVLRHRWGLVLSDDFFFRTWGDPVSWFVVYGLFLCALAESKGLFFLRWRPVVFMGRISFGVYLFHFPVMLIFKEMDVPHLAKPLLSFVVTTTVATASLYLFETPVRQRIRGWGQPVERTGTSAPSH